jgi:hypothetical protein
MRSGSHSATCRATSARSRCIGNVARWATDLGADAVRFASVERRQPVSLGSVSANRLPGSDVCDSPGLPLAVSGRSGLAFSPKLRLSAALFAAPESPTSHFPRKFAECSNPATPIIGPYTKQQYIACSDIDDTSGWCCFGSCALYRSITPFGAADFAAPESSPSPSLFPVSSLAVRWW